MSSVEAHRRQLQRLMKKQGAARLKKMYEEANAVLERKLRRLIARGRKGEFTAHQLRIAQLQIRQGIGQLSRKLSGALGVTAEEAQVDALRGLMRDVAKLEKKFTGADITLPIEEAARFRGVIDSKRTSLSRMHKTSMARYGSRLIRKMEDQMSLSLATGENADAAIDRIQKVADNEWWQAERVIRTEMAWSYNETHAAGIAESAKEIPDMMARWSEHVDDFTLRPLDDRVGEDSIAMHGQIAPPGGVFTMPPTPGVSPSLWNRTWTHPPNRPNDRAVLSPYRKVWGIPGWEWKGGRKVWVVR